MNGAQCVIMRGIILMLWWCAFSLGYQVQVRIFKLREWMVNSTYTMNSCKIFLSIIVLQVLLVSKAFLFQTELETFGLMMCHALVES